MSEKVYKILCYGDSNTYGFDPRMGAPEQLPKDVRWTGILDAMPCYEIINRGLNGREIPHSQSAFRDLEYTLERHRDCDILVIMLGTNDLACMWHPSAERVGKRMRELFDYVPGLAGFRQDGRKTILLSPPLLDLADDREDGILLEASRGLAQVYRKTAEELGLYFADTALWRIHMTYDEVHFSGAGHKTFAGEMDRLLRRVIAAASPEDLKD